MSYPCHYVWLCIASGFLIFVFGLLLQVDSKDLREVLRSQIEEQKKLLEATEKEKSHFLKLIQDFQNNARSLK